MLIKKSIIFLVLAALAQVWSVAGTASAGINATEACSTPFDEVLGRPCLPVKYLEVTLDVLYLKLMDEQTATACLDCKERYMSFALATTDCDEYSKHKCQAINECKSVCGVDIWVLMKEIYRCKELHSFKIYNDFIRNQIRDMENRIKNHNERPGAVQEPWKVDKKVKDKVFRDCPLDCNEYLPGDVDVDATRRVDNVVLNISVSEAQDWDFFPSFDIKTIHNVSAETDPVAFPEHACSKISTSSTPTILGKAWSCLENELTPIEMAYCADCILEFETHMNVFDMKKCSEIFTPFCKPSWNCARCGSCRKYVNAAILCSKEDEMQCSWNCDDYLSQENPSVFNETISLEAFL